MYMILPTLYDFLKDGAREWWKVDTLIFSAERGKGENRKKEHQCHYITVHYTRVPKESLFNVE